MPNIQEIQRDISYITLPPETELHNFATKLLELEAQENADISLIIYSVRCLIKAIVGDQITIAANDLSNLKPILFNIIDLVRDRLFTVDFIRDAPLQLRYVLMINPQPIRMLMEKYQLTAKQIVTLSANDIVRLVRHADDFVECFNTHKINFSDLQHLALNEIIDLVTVKHTVSDFCAKLNISILHFSKLPSEKMENLVTHPQQLTEIENAAQLSRFRF